MLLNEKYGAVVRSVDRYWNVVGGGAVSCGRSGTVGGDRPAGAISSRRSSRIGCAGCWCRDRDARRDGSGVPRVQDEYEVSTYILSLAHRCLVRFAPPTVKHRLADHHVSTLRVGVKNRLTLTRARTLDNGHCRRR